MGCVRLHHVHLSFLVYYFHSPARQATHKRRFTQALILQAAKLGVNGLMTDTCNIIRSNFYYLAHELSCLLLNIRHFIRQACHQ